MIQRPGNCPECGHWDPFHPSWYTPEKEVAEPRWIAEWDLEVLQLLKEYRDIIVQHEDGEWRYHLTKGDRTVERWPISIDKVGFSPQEKGERRNYHLKGKRQTMTKDLGLLRNPASPTIIPQKPESDSLRKEGAA